MYKIFIVFISLFLLGGAEDKMDPIKDIINIDGKTREYYISLPKNTSKPVPLIINFHGFLDHAINQKEFSQMDNYAHQNGVGVVYPEGIKRSWNVGKAILNDENDIGFVNTLIDSVSSKYNIDSNRIYACGFSNGGSFSYELMCSLSNKIAAFGSVGGNFSINENRLCNIDREIPLIHIHGTRDRLQKYNSLDRDFLSTIESVNYWAKYNQLDIKVVENIEDIHKKDGTAVEKYTYSKNNSNTQVIHFKVVDGGHLWLGSPIGDRFLERLLFGRNNHEINSSEEIVDFFLKYKLSDFN
jgi:polyhydroxybutyrate depolymerase